MPLVLKWWVLSLGIAAAVAADKPRFQVGPASSYPARATQENVTIAVKVFETGGEEGPFGKEHPYKHGVLPVLVVIQNDGKQSLRVDRIQAEYLRPDGERLEATPPGEVRFVNSPRKPGVIAGPVGVKVTRRKNPLENAAIEERAFSAKMIPPGDSASGFFYYQTGFQLGAKLYITGLAEAGSGKELFFFEIPLREAR
jgi:hypothetical protein